MEKAETAYQRGEVEDYYLFPKGRLKEGRALLKWCVAGYLCPTATRKMFREIEEAADVEHQQGRSFYGLRRQATDLAAEFHTDARVLNRITGHLDTATRERVYQILRTSGSGPKRQRFGGECVSTFERQGTSRGMLPLERSYPTQQE